MGGGGVAKVVNGDTTTTSQEPTEVLAMLVRMTAQKSEKPIHLIWGPPSAANISISEAASGAKVGTGAAEDRRLAAIENAMGGGK